MYNIFYNSVFLLVSFYFAIKSIAYGLYEINNKSNKAGGICVISFSIIVTIFVNIIIWIR